MSKEKEDQRANTTQRGCYSEFVQGIQLQGIHLMKLQAESKVSRVSTGSAGARVSFHVEYDKDTEPSKHFTMQPSLRVVFSSRNEDTENDETYGSISVDLVLRYTSKVMPDEQLLKIFSERNVPVNAWPYLRENVQSMTTRFGWNPFVLPPFYAHLSEAPEKSISHDS